MRFAACFCDTFGNRTILAPDGVTTRAASSYNQQIGFTGRYLDKETGLWFFRARYYSGTLGRFVSRDYTEFQQDYGGEYSSGHLLYGAYFIPNRLDPTGHFDIAASIANLFKNGPCWKYDFTAVTVTVTSYAEKGRGLRGCVGLSKEKVQKEITDMIKPPYKDEKKCDGKKCDCEEIFKIANPEFGPLPIKIWVTGWSGISFSETKDWRCEVSIEFKVKATGSGMLGICKDK